MAEKFSLTAQLHLQAPKNVKQVFNQIQGQLKGASVDVEVKKGTQAVKDLGKIASATKKVEQEAKAATSATDKMGKAFGSALKNVLRYDLARRVFTAFTNTLEQGVKDAIQFEREMIKIAQVSGQTMKQLKGLQNTVTQLATSLGVSSSSLVKIGLILKQTGLTVRDTELAMKALAKTELAPTFDNIADTAETAVAAMRQFGIEAARLEGLLSKINTVAANFAVEASDIGVAIKRAGGAFKAAGGEVEELIALFTSVRSTTRETAETIATGFRTIFTRLQRPTTIKFLRQFGIELTDLNGKFVGPYEAVKRLSNALKGISPQDLRFSTIVEQLGGFRQVSKVIPLIQEFGTSQAALNAQLEGSDSLAKDAATAQQALAVQMQKVTENVKEMFRTMVQSDAFQTIASLALKLADAITKIGKALAPVLPILGAFVAARAAAWAGGKLMGGGFGGLNKALGTASGDASDVFRGNRGGRVRRFSRGGWVPGTGNGDTVPAMLEPGEFVLRKSAAQAFGSRLNGINKYTNGGKTRRSPFPEDLWYHHAIDGDSLNVDYVPKSEKINTSSRLLGFDAFETSLRRGTSPQEKELGKIATQFAENYFSPLGNEGVHKKFTAAGAGFTGKEKYGRLPFSDSNYGNALVKAGLGVVGDGAGGTVWTDAKTPGPKLMAMAQKGKRIPTGIKQGPAGNLYTQWVSAIRAKLAEKEQIKKVAKKTSLHRANKGGLVPSLLTPGEFVVNKKSAQSMGYGKLRKMNKYAGGGTVSRFNAGGGVGGGGIMGNMINLAFLKDFRKGTVQATKGLYQAGESGFWAYTQTQAYGAAVSATTSMLGIQNDALDGFISLLTNSLSIISAFNAVMTTAAAQQGIDTFSNVLSSAGDAITMFGGKFKGGKGILGKLTKSTGGAISSAGKNVGARQFGLFATGARQKTRAADVLGRRAISLRKGAGAQFGKARELAATARGKAAKLADARKAFEGLKPGTAARKAAGARLGGLTKSANAARASADAAIKSAKAGKAAAQGMSSVASKAGNMAKMFKALNVAGFVATYAIGKFGDKLKGDALQEIADTGGGAGYSGAFGKGEAGLIRKHRTGAAVSGAAIGAGVGMIFGPLGAVVGGLVGAGIGLIAAWGEAEKAISAAKFNKAVESMASTMESYENDLISAQSALGSVMGNMETMSANAWGSEGGGVAEQNAAAKNARKLVQAMADGSNSVSEFEAKLSGNREQLDKFGITTEASVQALRDEISERVIAQEKMQKYAEAQERARKELEKLRGISSVIDEMENRMSRWDTAQAAITNPVGAARIGGGINQLLQTTSRDQASIDRLETTIDKLGNMAGEGDVGLASTAQQAKDFAFLDRNITQALTVASNFDNLGPDRVQDEIMKQLRTQYRDQEGGAEMSEYLEKHLEGIFQGADLTDISGNMDALSDEFKKGAEEAYETYRKAADLVDNQTKRLASMYEARRNLEQQYIQQQQDLLGKRQSIEQEYLDNVAAFGDKGISNEQVQANFSERQKLALTGVGGQVSGMGALGDLPTDVDSVSSAFKTVSAQLRESNDKFSQMGVDPSVLTEQDALASGINKQLSEHDKLTKQYQTLQGVLKDYENVQQRLVAINRDLAESQKRDKTFQQYLDDAIYGTAEEKAGATDFHNAMALAIQEGTIHAVRPELQRQVKNAFESGVMGQEGKDVIKADRRNALLLAGKDPNQAGIMRPSDETKRLAEERRKIQLEGVKAGETLSSETNVEIKAMSDAIKSANAQFITDLKNLFQEEHNRRIKESNQVAAGELRSLQGTERVYNKLIAALPKSMQDDDEAISRAAKFIADNRDAYMKNVQGYEKIKGLGEGGYNMSKYLEWVGGYMNALDTIENEGRANSKAVKDAFAGRAARGDKDELGAAIIMRTAFKGRGMSQEQAWQLSENALGEGWVGTNELLGDTTWGGSGQKSIDALSSRTKPSVFTNLRDKFVNQTQLFTGEEFEALFQKHWDNTWMKGTTADFFGLLMRDIAAKQDNLFNNIRTTQDQSKNVLGARGPEVLRMFSEAQAKLLRDQPDYKKLKEAMKKHADAINDSIDLEHEHQVLKKAVMLQEAAAADGKKLTFDEAKSVVTKGIKLNDFVNSISKPKTPEEKAQAADALMNKGKEALNYLIGGGKYLDKAKVPYPTRGSEAEMLEKFNKIQSGEAPKQSKKDSKPDTPEEKAAAEEAAKKYNNYLYDQLITKPKEKMGQGVSQLNRAIEHAGSMTKQSTRVTEFDSLKKPLGQYKYAPQAPLSQGGSPVPIEDLKKEFQYDPAGKHGSLGPSKQKEMQRKEWERQQKSKEIAGTPGEVHQATVVKGEVQKVQIVPGSSSVLPLGGGHVGDANPEADAAIQSFKDTMNALKEKAKAAGVSEDVVDRTTSPQRLQFLINNQKRINELRGGAPGTNDQTQIDGAKAMIELASHGMTKSATSSIYTHDHIAHDLLAEMLDVLRAQGGSFGDVLQAQMGGEGTGNTVVGGGLSEVVQTFSKGVDQLAAFMGNPLTITVGGTITMDVKLNGAEWFRDAEGSLKQMAGKQITQGINNFIRHGLRDARVNTRDNWVDTLDGVGVPMGSNPHSNTA